MSTGKNGGWAGEGSGTQGSRTPSRAITLCSPFWQQAGLPRPQTRTEAPAPSLASKLSGNKQGFSSDPRALNHSSCADPTLGSHASLLSTHWGWVTATGIHIHKRRQWLRKCRPLMWLKGCMWGIGAERASVPGHITTCTRHVWPVVRPLVSLALPKGRMR